MRTKNVKYSIVSWITTAPINRTWHEHFSVTNDANNAVILDTYRIFVHDNPFKVNHTLMYNDIGEQLGRPD